jgi:hypothetical protein
MRASLIGLLALSVSAFAGTDSTYTFDASEFERRAFELGGYLEYRLDHFRLNRDGAFYGLSFYQDRQRASLDRNAAALKLEGTWTRGSRSARARTHLEYLEDDRDAQRTSRFDELAASWKPDPGLAVEAGKIALKWGKGYAWNPVGFVERLKDPNDPELAREGFWMATADWVRTLAGPLKTIAFTPVVLPTGADVNSDYGRRGHTNVAAKLYLLWYDTDVDFVFLAGGSRTRRFGFDFSRNLASNLEVHGEWARIEESERRVVTTAGAPAIVRSDAVSYLLGARYLTGNDATWIVEYYRNDAGYTKREMQDFFGFVDSGLAQFQSTGSDALLDRANAAASAGYARPQAMRRYAYLRISQKDPFDILYFTPAVTSIVNVSDGSFSITPELLYTGITNVELRLRLFLLHGRENADFGEKQSARRLELRARLYF